MKNYILYNGRNLKSCSPVMLSACIKYCWGHITGKRRRWAKQKLYKIANVLAKEAYNNIEKKIK